MMRIDTIAIAERAGVRLYGRSPRLTLVVVGEIHEPHAPGRWVLQEKTDHLLLGQVEEEFGTPAEAIACLRAYSGAQRAAA